MELIIILGWLSMAFIPLFWLKKPIRKFNTSFLDYVIIVAMAPVVFLFVKTDNREYWIETNLKECRKLLEPWNIFIEVTSFNTKNNLYISWAFDSQMPGRKHENRVPAYTALRELEKMPVDEWALKYLPRTEEVIKGVDLKPVSKTTFKPYRK